MKKEKGITLISLVITIIIIIILASVAIYLGLSNNGIFNRAKEARELTNKQTATEKINLKITNCQMNKYAEEQRMPTLKELSLVLGADNEIQYVTESTQIGSTKYEVGENPSSIYTKLNEYPYEFEINSSLQLASINGVKIANGNNNDSIKLKLDYNGLNVVKYADGTATYKYEGKDIYPLYWYGYKENVITPKARTSDAVGDIYERTDIKTELTSYLRLTETDNYEAISYTFNDNLDYSKYTKMKVKIKNYNISSSGVFSYGIFQGTESSYIKYNSCIGKNGRYNSNPVIQKGELEVDISDINHSLYENEYAFIRLYREGDSSLYVDVEAVWFE